MTTDTTERGLERLICTALTEVDPLDAQDDPGDSFDADAGADLGEPGDSEDDPDNPFVSNAEAGI